MCAVRGGTQKVPESLRYRLYSCIMQALGKGPQGSVTLATVHHSHLGSENRRDTLRASGYCLLMGTQAVFDSWRWISCEAAPTNLGINEVFEISKIPICSWEHRGNYYWACSTEPLISHFSHTSSLNPAGQPCRGPKSKLALVSIGREGIPRNAGFSAVVFCARRMMFVLPLCKFVALMYIDEACGPVTSDRLSNPQMKQKKKTGWR